MRASPRSDLRSATAVWRDTCRASAPALRTPAPRRTVDGLAFVLAAVLVAPSAVAIGTLLGW